MVSFRSQITSFLTSLDESAFFCVQVQKEKSFCVGSWMATKWRRSRSSAGFVTCWHNGGSIRRATVSTWHYIYYTVYMEQMRHSKIWIFFTRLSFENELDFFFFPAEEISLFADVCHIADPINNHDREIRRVAKKNIDFTVEILRPPVIAIILFTLIYL